jgi:hypothetical protein
MESQQIAAPRLARHQRYATNGDQGWPTYRIGNAGTVRRLQVDELAPEHLCKSSPTRGTEVPGSRRTRQDFGMASRSRAFAMPIIGRGSNPISENVASTQIWPCVSNVAP